MNTYKQRITVDALIAERANTIRKTKTLIKKYSKHVRHFDHRDKNQLYCRLMFDNMCIRTRGEMKDSVRSMHLVKAFLKGQRFDKVEQTYYHPTSYKMAVRNPTAYGIAEERRRNQVEAINTAHSFLEKDQGSDFMLWVRNTSGMKDNHEY